ncbi:uncharacterized protein [Medicago truncatula]|uniref:uncharacterized protein isoform X2 n=1 Tax=Medicago truncatula TaxID=3880 RepID=UPI000D2F2170|nr:uncharacterized protein LOC11430616 isoform X2 [Medicago truncatula]
MSDLTFRVGETIESKTFITGYRGAWFRCKIVKIGKKDGVASYSLAYPDYPDQKISQIKVYQIPSHITKSKASKKELMVRPPFPTIYRESEKLDVNAFSEVIVIVNDEWKVGDLVDWFSDGCYWCGKVTEVFGNDKVQEEGCRCPARIMNPASSDGSVNVGQSSYRTVERREQRSSVGNSVDIEEAGSKSGGTSISSSHIMDASIENFERTASNSRCNDDDYPAKKMRSNLSLCLNSMSSNTMESAILDLEELVNKIKWLRAVLKSEVPLSGAKRPSWEFLQHHASCI